MDSASKNEKIDIEEVDLSRLEVEDEEEEAPLTTLKTTEKLPELKEYSGKNIAVQVAAGAILGSLSIIIGFSWDALVERMGGFNPPFAPGMTWIDFLAIPILVAFLVFGLLSGFIAAVIGCGAIAFYLSEAFGWLAMIPKFLATASMFFFPWLVLKIMHRLAKRTEKQFFKRFPLSSEAFKPVLNYVFLMLIAIFSRAIVMFIANVFVIAPVYLWLYSNKTQFSTVFTNPVYFLTVGGGYASWNLVQGVFDALISYLIVYPTNLYKQYATW